MVQTKNNCRIIKTLDPKDIQKWLVAVLDPDLSAVAKLPPHHWKIVGGKVIPKTRAQRFTTDRAIRKNGGQPDNTMRIRAEVKHRTLWYILATAIILGSIYYAYR